MFAEIKTIVKMWKKSYEMNDSSLDLDLREWDFSISICSLFKLIVTLMHHC